MNIDILKGHWKEIRGEIKKKWGNLTDDEVAETEGHEDKMVGLLQRKYGYARDKAQQEYDEFMSRHGKSQAK